jgi:hypothetical protein
MKEKRAKYKRGEIGKTGPMLKNFLAPPDELVLSELVEFCRRLFVNYGYKVTKDAR